MSYCLTLRRTFVAFLVAPLMCSATFAQVYRPVVPPASMVGGYGYPSYASTAAGSAMNGMASVISARGDNNLSTSEAAENLTQAQSQEIQNRQQYTNTYFSMRETNDAERATLAGPRPTEQELVKIAQEGVPSPLASDEMNPVNGSLTWPDMLNVPGFAAQRNQIDQLFAKRTGQGGLTYAEKNEVHQAVYYIFGEMKKYIGELDPQDYVAAREFLNRVLYSTTQNELS